MPNAARIRAILVGGDEWNRGAHTLADALNVLMQDTLRGSAAANMRFLDPAKMVAVLDDLAKPDADAGHRVVMDQVLTLALSFVFMHEGLGLSA